MALPADEIRSTCLETGLRKAHWRLVPLLGLCYLVAYMDRANISFAAESMNRDLGFTPAVYGLGAGLFFISYALCEIPSNRALLRFGARRWLARIMLTWGVLAGAMVLVRSAHEFYALRLLLGMAEAGFFPGAVFYLATWFPARQRVRAISRFYVAYPVSNVVMGTAAGALLDLNGRLGLRGWQWLFLVEAAPAIVLGAVLWAALPNGPDDAKWLTAEERTAVIEEAGRTPVHSPHGGEDLWSGLRLPSVWLLAVMLFCLMTGTYALTFSLPLLLRELTGKSAAQVGYMIAATAVAGAAAMLAVGAWSDRRGERVRPVRWAFVMMGGCVLLAGADLHGAAAAVALLVAGLAYYAILGPFVGLMTEAVPGRAGALAVAAINMCGIFGGFAGPYWMGVMRERTGSYALPIGGLAGLFAVGLGCLWWFDRGRLEGMEASAEDVNAGAQ